MCDIEGADWFGRLTFVDKRAEQAVVGVPDDNHVPALRSLVGKLAGKMVEGAEGGAVLIERVEEGPL